MIDANDPAFANYAGPSVRIDNAGGAAGLTRHLIERGAKRMLFVQQLANHLTHQERWNGARSRWLAERPLEQLSFCMLDELGDQMLRTFVAQPGGAIFCSNDQCAMEVWHRLQRLGISVPQQVLLVGFDGEEFGKLIGLTTAVVHGDAIGAAAFEMLVKLIHGEEQKMTLRRIPTSVRPGLTTDKKE
jgi:DNA-binding LacI/PurR family transcriptional regulator